MEKYSLEQLKEKGLELAKTEGASQIVATSDGNFFTPENISYAKLHVRTNKGVELFEINYTAEEVESEKTTKGTVKKTVDQKIEDISKLETLAAVEEYVVAEKSQKVLAAAEKRKQEIKAAEIAVDAAAGRN